MRLSRLSLMLVVPVVDTKTDRIADSMSSNNWLQTARRYKNALLDRALGRPNSKQHI
jgi:hypothetical protein